jgi:hypothetical protein
MPAGAVAAARSATTGAAAGSAGFLDSSRPSTRLVALLDAGAARYQWAAATANANSAAGYQLATGYPVMAIGGFNGSDPAISLASFEQYVAQGRIHYFVAAGGGPGGGGSSTDASQITAWVQAHFTATTVGGVTVYDLTAPKS